MAEYKYTPRMNGKMMTTIRVDIHLDREELERLLRRAKSFGDGIDPKRLIAIYVKEGIDFVDDRDEDG